MFKWFKKVVFENYANFNGRARRSEFWYFILLNTIFSVTASIIDDLVGLKIGSSQFGIIQSLYSLLFFLPGLAVTVRRLHDVGKSGWWLLVFYIVSGISVAGILIQILSWGFIFSGAWFHVFFLIIVGIDICFIITFCIVGDKGTNKYGPDPKFATNKINEIETGYNHH